MMKFLKRNISVKREFTLVSIAIITIILIIYSIVQVFSFGIFSINNQRTQIENTYKELDKTLKDISKSSEIIDSISKVSGENIRIYNDDEVLYKTDIDEWKNISLKSSDGTELKIIDFKPYLLLNKPIDLGKYTIQILQRVDILTELMERYVKIFLAIFFMSVSFSIVGAIYLSKKFLSRIKNLTHTMEGIKENKLDKRVPIEGTYDEFDRMNMLFNSMMDEIQDSFERQSQFSSDASHELKTPLTVLQGHLKMLDRWGKDDREILDNSINVCLDEIDRMINLINEILDLSKADNYVVNHYEIDFINPIDIILETIENYNMLNSDIVFNLGIIDEKIKIKIKKEHLKQLLMIIIDNSIKYNDKNVIVIDINLGKKEDGVFLSIKDNGMGIEENNIPRVTDRFFKSDKSRQRNNSFGLGLSIAEKIVSLYNGKIQIDSAIKEYTEITLIF